MSNLNNMAPELLEYDEDEDEKKAGGGNTPTSNKANSITPEVDTPAQIGVKRSLGSTGGIAEPASKNSKVTLTSEAKIANALSDRKAGYASSQIRGQ